MGSSLGVHPHDSHIFVSFSKCTPKLIWQICSLHLGDAQPNRRESLLTLVPFWPRTRNNANIEKSGQLLEEQMRLPNTLGTHKRGLRVDAHSPLDSRLPRSSMDPLSLSVRMKLPRSCRDLVVYNLSRGIVHSDQGQIFTVCLRTQVVALKFQPDEMSKLV